MLLALLNKLRTSIEASSKLKYYVNTKNLVQIYHSLIENQFRYDILVWNHENKCLVQKLQHVQITKQPAAQHVFIFVSK